jgi:hypothetical protein
MKALPWTRLRIKSQIYTEALDAAWSDTLKEKTEDIKEGLRKRRERVGMFGFVDTPESRRASEELAELEKKPRYEGQHRDIVRTALKAGMPVPSRVIADYFDEPWAAAEMLRRAKHQGFEYFKGSEKPDLKRLPSADYPVLRDRLLKLNGKPLYLFAVLREHPPSSNAIGARVLHVCEVFLHEDDARKFLESAGPEERCLRAITLRFKHEHLAVEYFGMEWEDLILLEKLLPHIESCLNRN